MAPASPTNRTITLLRQWVVVSPSDAFPRRAESRGTIDCGRAFHFYNHATAIALRTPLQPIRNAPWSDQNSGCGVRILLGSRPKLRTIQTRLQNWFWEDGTLKSEWKKTRLQLLRCAGIALLSASALVSSCYGGQRTVLTLSAAASLQDALVEAENAYKHNHADVDFRNNFGSSGTLAREIEDGAPVDAFLSAASKPMDDLQAKGLVAAGTRQNLCATRWF